VASRFRLSGAQKKRLAQAAARDGLVGNPCALAYRLGEAGALDRLLIAGAPIAPLPGWPIPSMPLKGGDIVARGVKAGPMVARLLQRLETRWIEAGFPDAQATTALLDAVLAEDGGAA